MASQPVTPSDLPPPGTVRWVPRRKAAVVAAIRDGRLSRIDACRRYALSEEELRHWEHALACVGEPGLRATRSQVYRALLVESDPKAGQGTPNG
ncbi:MAG: DUF1153 domain-containing protein [Sphingomonadales bacterium]|jgi:hypothetical protein